VLATSAGIVGSSDLVDPHVQLGDPRKTSTISCVAGYPMFLRRSYAYLQTTRVMERIEPVLEA